MNAIPPVLLCAAALAAAQTGASAQVINVNGQPQDFVPGPLERNGRIFVPLRGIFERLGATVVYSNGQINATGSTGRTVALRIGSTSAVVNGQEAALDVAPFLVGDSTYVPLRFVSQALGANVNYDSSNNTIAIATNGNGREGGNRPSFGNRPPDGGYAPPPAQRAPEVALASEQPQRGSAVSSRRPTIEASFTQDVDPNSVRVSLDGLDVTGDATRSQRGIVYAPRSPLQDAQHQVRVEGTDRFGHAFAVSWSFVSGA